MKHLLVAATLIVALSTLASADDFRPIFHPPTISILEALQQDPNQFSTLIGLLIKADLKELRYAKASYTLLAPTNAAFAKLSPEYFAKLTNDPTKLRQLLLAHLLPGKVTFKELFAPDQGGVAKKKVTKSLKTAEGNLAYFECDEHPAYTVSQHLPLINKKARVLKSDIEGTYSVIHVIDTALMHDNDL
jgi:transforming growth factor-beta-induced protein